MTFIPTRGPLARALAERNYDKLTPVQTAVLADEAAGRDLLVSAQTGSGKTVAYGLAIAKDLLGDADRFEQRRRSAGVDRRADPRARDAGPARTDMALSAMPAPASCPASAAWIRAVSSAILPTARTSWSARRDGCAIICGAAGSTSRELKAVVLDEADEMLDMGFREDLEFILKTTPETRRTLLFSATLPRGIVALAKQYQRDGVPHRGRRATKAAMPTSNIARCAIAAQRRRARGRQCAALFRIARRAGVLQHAQCRPSSAGGAAGARIFRGRAVGRIDPERTQPGPAGAARRPRARLRCDRRGGARHRSAEPRSRHPCRTAERSGSAAASLRPHRPGGPQGRQPFCWCRRRAGDARKCC